MADSNVLEVVCGNQGRVLGKVWVLPEFVANKSALFLLLGVMLFFLSHGGTHVPQKSRHSYSLFKKIIFM